MALDPMLPSVRFRQFIPTGWDVAAFVIVVCLLAMIATAGQQQLVGMDQVATAMESIKQASGQNVAGAKQLEIAARNLNDLGGRLTQIVEKYKL